MKRTIQLMGSVMAGSFIAVTAAFGQVNYATPYSFITIAGTVNTVQSANGLNGAGTFEYPQALVADTNDNVYVVDNLANVVVRVSPAGGTNWQVTAIAGTPDSTGSGDGNNQSARFSEPSGIAIDSSNNLYVADTGNNTLRRIVHSGSNWAVTTIAGTAGVFGGDTDGTNGMALFSGLSGVAADTAGNVYVADTDNHIIRMVVPMGTNWVVTTIAGSPKNSGSDDGTNRAAKFSGPVDVAVDRFGNLFVADSGNSTIREIQPVGTNWVVTTIAGTVGSFAYADGTNTSSEFNYPAEIAVDAGGNIYVADSGNNAVRKISPVGTNWVTTTLAGDPNGNSGSSNGIGPTAQFYSPYGVTVDVSGKLFVADTYNNIIREGFVAAVPNLAIGPGVGNTVVVSWPGSFGTLQTNSDLTTANWAAYGGTVNNSSGTNSVTITPPAQPCTSD